MNYQEPKDLFDYTTEELNTFADQYEYLINQIESFLQQKKVSAYLCDNEQHDRCYIEGIAGFEGGYINITMEGGGCGRGCCTPYTFKRSIPIDWITENKWEAEIDKINAVKLKKKKAEERKKETDRRKRDEAELERLQKKLSKKA